VAIVVVGGSTRNIGKTSVVAGLIAGLPRLHWTAFKITQYGHGFCTADGKPCACQTEDACVAVTPERDPAGRTDSSRFLSAGAPRSFWVRTRIGQLSQAMPRVRELIDSSENAILESNSVLDFLAPDLYLTVLDPSVADFKTSARRLLARADAILIPARDGMPQPAPDLSEIAGKPVFSIAPPAYVTAGLIDFVRARLAQVPDPAPHP